MRRRNGIIPSEKKMRPTHRFLYKQNNIVMTTKGLQGEKWLERQLKRRKINYELWTQEDAMSIVKLLHYS